MTGERSEKVPLVFCTARGEGRTLSTFAAKRLYHVSVNLRLGVLFAQAFPVVAAVAGCGSGLADRAATRPLFLSPCPDGAPIEAAAELVILDWNGGEVPLYPDEHFDPIDLAAFDIDDGTTLADSAAIFKERVRSQVAQILCESSGPRVTVRTAEFPGEAADSVLILTQALSPGGGAELGEAEFDPCNRQHDNTAIVFGEKVRQMAGENSFDEWVMILANVAAHEIAHTLGFAHIDRRESSATQRSIFVELMLDGHTISQLRREQRFLATQSYCPDNPVTSRRAAHRGD